MSDQTCVCVCVYVCVTFVLFQHQPVLHVWSVSAKSVHSCLGYKAQKSNPVLDLNLNAIEIQKLTSSLLAVCSVSSTVLLLILDLPFGICILPPDLALMPRI